MRRQEMARRRRNLSEKRNEEVKVSDKHPSLLFRCLLIYKHAYKHASMYIYHHTEYTHMHFILHYY